MDLDGVLEVVAAVLILVGSALALVAAIGLFRMPDAYSRIHVATKPATPGRGVHRGGRRAEGCPG